MRGLCINNSAGTTLYAATLYSAFCSCLPAIHFVPEFTHLTSTNLIATSSLVSLFTASKTNPKLPLLRYLTVRYFGWFASGSGTCSPVPTSMVFKNLC
jgi:hypothetical protein